MSIEEFIQEIFEENQEDLDEIRRLQEILDQLDSEESVIYTVSITSNL
jgi:transcriptional regulator CtsR